MNKFTKPFTGHDSDSTLLLKVVGNLYLGQSTVHITSCAIMMTDIIVVKMLLSLFVKNIEL